MVDGRGRREGITLFGGWNWEGKEWWELSGGDEMLLVVEVRWDG